MSFAICIALFASQAVGLCTPWNQLDMCTGGATPTLKDRCFDCKSCTAVLNPTCPTPRVCNATEKATREPYGAKDHCCRSCKHPVQPADCRPSSCPLKIIMNLQACSADTKDTIDCEAGDTFGCPSCVPRALAGITADSLGACTDEKIKRCREAQEDCEDQQEPWRKEGQCCRSCRDPSSRCSLQDVGVCATSQERRTCTAKEMVRQVRTQPGDCCPCRPPKPRCDPKCDRATGHVCVPTKRDSLTDFKCVDCRLRKMRLKFAETASEELLKDKTPEEVREILLELVNRYCSRDAVSEKRCERVKEIIEDMDIVEFKREKARHFALKICFRKLEARDGELRTRPGTTAAPTRRRLLEGDEPAGIVTDAVNTESTIIATDDGEASANAVARLSPPSAVLMVLAGLMYLVAV